MKRYIKLFSALALSLVTAISLSLPAFASDIRLSDYAGLLDESEFSDVLYCLESESDSSEFAFAVVTINSAADYGYSDNETGDRDFADDFWDNHDYGYTDGALLLIDMDTRYCYISTAGYGIEAITDSGIGYILDIMTANLSAGNYALAIKDFVYTASSLVEQARNGNIFDNYDYEGDYDYYSDPVAFNWIKSIGIALVIGIIIAAIVTSVMKGKLQSVKPQSNATRYEVPNSLNVTEKSDVFLYSTVSVMPKPKNTSSGSHSGSSVHTSSGGHSHGGGGGHF